MLTQCPDAPLILIVEDDKNHAELIQRSLGDAPEEYRLEIVDTICGAKRASNHQSPSLVLTDYRLPDGDGSEIVVMADGRWPVIMMTSHGSERVAVEAMKIGAQDYIVKSPDAFEGMPGTLKYALITWALIVARRLATEADLRAKKDWELTFDAVPDLIAIIDLNHTITRVNKAMVCRCGLAPEEMIGRKCYEVMHGSSVLPDHCPYVRMMQDGMMHHQEIEEKRLDGVFEVSVSPLHTSEGQLTDCVHVMREVTERKRAEEKRQLLEQQFQQTQKLESLGVLAGGIAHDFNNILTIILGHCFMAMEAGDSSDSPLSHVMKIESAANRAADLCRQMLAYAGNSPLLNVQINLWLLVDEIVKMLQSALKKNVTIKLDLKRDVPVISGDNAQLQQVVMNLIINAAEAIGDEHGTIRVVLNKLVVPGDHVVLDFAGNVIPAGSYACLEVSDDGCGMDEEVRKRLFEPFYTTKFTGRGLGMSAVLGIVKLHDGVLQLSSTPGVGTTFKVCFPLPGRTDAKETTPKTGSLPAVMAHGTVLLVDDEEALRSIGSALLNAMGFSIITASNGREALDIYLERGSSIDLVLLDFVMPEMGGAEVFYKLREISPRLPIVFCSGYSNEIIPESIGCDAYSVFVHKPYNLDQLRSTMLHLLELNP